MKNVHFLIYPRTIAYKPRHIFIFYNLGSSLLSGTWEIELPISEFLNTPSSPPQQQQQQQDSINDPNSVSNRQCPMIQISKELKIISLPLSTDIANPHIHEKYLKNISICTNSTKLKFEEKDVIKLVHDNEHNSNDNTILEGSISLTTPPPHSIKWSDGSVWNKQGIIDMETSHSAAQMTETGTPSLSGTDHPSNTNNHELYSQIEILREKEKMAKTQSQAMMVS